MPTLLHGLVENWPIWLLSVILIVAAVIDGWILKVPNWLTFPLVLAGWTPGRFAAASAVWLGAWQARWWGWGCCCQPMPSAAWAPAT